MKVEAGKYIDLWDVLKRGDGSITRCEMCRFDGDDVESNIRQDDETCEGRNGENGYLYSCELCTAKAEYQHMKFIENVTLVDFEDHIFREVQIRGFCGSFSNGGKEL